MKLDPDSQQSTSLGDQDNTMQNLEKKDDDQWGPSPWAIYQNDFGDKPKWYGHYLKNVRNLSFRISAFVNSEAVTNGHLQSYLNINIIMNVK